MSFADGLAITFQAPISATGKHAADREKHHGSCTAPRTKAAASARIGIPPAETIGLDGPCLHEGSAPSAPTRKPSSCGVCHVHGAQKRDRGGELSARHSR